MGMLLRQPGKAPCNCFASAGVAKKDMLLRPNGWLKARTLVRRAIEGGDHAGLADHLVGPTAITFVSGDVSAVAKALKDFSRSGPLGLQGLHGKAQAPVWYRNIKIKELK
jgi:hypothetical protein